MPPYWTLSSGFLELVHKVRPELSAVRSVQYDARSREYTLRYSDLVLNRARLWRSR